MNQTLIEQCLNFVEDESSLGCFLCNNTLLTRTTEAGIMPASSPPLSGCLHGRCCEAGWDEVDGFHIILTDKQLLDSLREAKQGAELSCPLPPPTSPPLGHEQGPEDVLRTSRAGLGPGAATPATTHLVFSALHPSPATLGCPAGRSNARVGVERDAWTALDRGGMQAQAMGGGKHASIE